MMHLNKLMFISSLTVGTFISISSYSWMGMWMGLEINLLSFIPLISNSKNMMASEAALKYFITQAIASTILLFSVIMLSTSIMYNLEMSSYISMILNSSLLTKMGAAPFHFWFPEVMEGLSWFSSLIMLTWQKIAPMVLLIYYNNNILFLSLIVLASMMISGVMGQNQTSLRKILTFSSINHVGWMIASSMFMETVWIYYFMIYSIITINIIMILMKMNIFHMKQLFMSMNNNNSIKLFFILNFLSLGGLPPFLGFIPKWLTVQQLIINNMFSLAILMITMTLMTLYFYLRVTFSTMLIMMNEIIYYKQPLINKIWILTSNFIALSSLILCTICFNYM
uniref:NADH-ubiquinone oxidoreductase chain 2 n=1 Tax=Sinodendron yunnanense TaxID=618637 RepID=A0A342D3U2_9SCAR|nr:NADH dehydrogenase subunit 2 [Sinodendron yunnanense]AKN01372.1 NADH dehydrogenase subunit 2 [Sinodendron yunnanense]